VGVIILCILLFWEICLWNYKGKVILSTSFLSVQDLEQNSHWATRQIRIQSLIFQIHNCRSQLFCLPEIQLTHLWDGVRSCPCQLDALCTYIKHGNGAWNMEGAQTVVPVILRLQLPSLTSSGGVRKVAGQSPWVWILLLWHFKVADLMASEEFLGAICSQVLLHKQPVPSWKRLMGFTKLQRQIQVRVTSFYGQVRSGP